MAHKTINDLTLTVSLFITLPAVGSTLFFT